MVEAYDFLYVFTRFLHICFKAIEKERAALADKCKDMEKDMRKMIKAYQKMQDKLKAWKDKHEPTISILY